MIIVVIEVILLIIVAVSIFILRYFLIPDCTRRRLRMIDTHYQRSLYKNYENSIKSQKIKMIFNSNNLSDLQSLKFKSKIYSIVSRSLKGLANQKIIAKKFNKEYPRVLRFAIAKSMNRQGNVGLSSLLKDGREFGRKYYNIDIMEHKMTILPFIGKAFANLSGFLNVNKA